MPLEISGETSSAVGLGRVRVWLAHQPAVVAPASEPTSRLEACRSTSICKASSWLRTCVSSTSTSPASAAGIDHNGASNTWLSSSRNPPREGGDPMLI